jgi:formylglycine-generating enzyme required for sulfatase activity
MKTFTNLVFLAMLCAARVSPAADVFNMPAGQTSIAFATIGNPGNPADTAVMNDTTTGYGSVPYTYAMDKYDVTTAQYTRFLNAVAATDTYNLYSTGMDSGAGSCGITRSGSPGSYTYSIVAGHDNFPVNYVAWGDSARFANWLQNGQPTGAQGPGTTETGAYTLNGAVSTAALIAVSKNSNANYWIPSENEWYKSAYYNPTNSTYFTYSTSSNSQPSYVYVDLANHANYFDLINGFTEPTNYLTPVGFFSNSASPYGTYDQSGLVYDWNDAVISTSNRGLRGGGFNSTFNNLASTYRNASDPTNENFGVVGFRIASIPAAVPEPGSILLGLMGGAGFWFLARGRRS